jgi:hypothetical protein
MVFKQTAPYCLLLRPESPCRRGQLDLAIGNAAEGSGDGGLVAMSTAAIEAAMGTRILIPSPDGVMSQDILTIGVGSRAATMRRMKGLNA